MSKQETVKVLLWFAAFTINNCKLAYAQSADMLSLFKQPAVSYQSLKDIQIQSQQASSLYIDTLIQKGLAEQMLALNGPLKRTVGGLSDIQSKMTSKQRAWWLMLKGAEGFNSGELAESVRVLEQALALMTDSDDLFQRTMIVRELGYGHALIGQMFEANQLLHGQYNELIGNKNDVLEGFVAESLGDTYSYSGNLEKSLLYYQNALQAYEKHGFLSFIASTQLGIATTHRKLKQWDLAEAHFRQYEAALKRLGAKTNEQMFYLYYGLSATLAESQKCVEALPVMANALNANGPEDYDAEIYKKRALCHIALDNISDALRDFEAAKTILDGYPELRDTHWYNELNFINAKLLQAQEQYDEASALLSSYYTQALEIYENDNSEVIASISATLEAERKDKQIAELSQQAKVQAIENEAQRLRSQQLYFVLAILGFVLLGIIIFLVFQRKNELLLTKLSFTDDLTGLNNRRYFFNFVDRALTKERLQCREIAFIVFDIDNFKKINDSQGHQVGDTVIAQVAEIARENKRREDILCRVGGDEFIFLLRRTTTEQAKRFAQRLKDDVESKTPVTVSLGISHTNKFPSNRRGIDDLIERADKNLYESKRRGKNQFSFT